MMTSDYTSACANVDSSSDNANTKHRILHQERMPITADCPNHRRHPSGHGDTESKQLHGSFPISHCDTYGEQHHIHKKYKMEDNSRCSTTTYSAPSNDFEVMGTSYSDDFNNSERSNLNNNSITQVDKDKTEDTKFENCDRKRQLCFTNDQPCVFKTNNVAFKWNKYKDNITHKFESANSLSVCSRRSSSNNNGDNNGLDEVSLDKNNGKETSMALTQSPDVEGQNFCIAEEVTKMYTQKAIYNRLNSEKQRGISERAKIIECATAPLYSKTSDDYQHYLMIKEGLLSTSKIRKANVNDNESLISCQNNSIDLFIPKKFQNISSNATAMRPKVVAPINTDLDRHLSCHTCGFNSNSVSDNTGSNACNNNISTNNNVNNIGILRNTRRSSDNINNISGAGIGTIRNNSSYTTNNNTSNSTNIEHIDSNINNSTNIEHTDNINIINSSRFPLDDAKSAKFRVKESDGDNISVEKSGVTLTLLNSSLWRAFHRVGTEMIINRGGRRMFPYLSLSVKGLNPSAHYTVSVQIIPASARRCKFINSKWVPVGLADTEATQLPYYHLDSPSLGHHWNRTKINFSKIKLTNNKESSSQNILLHSMHKYSIITTFTQVDFDVSSSRPSSSSATTTSSSSSSLDGLSLSFHLPETDFIAVTAYQNESVTQMKIHNNPFAKAFRDASFTEIRKRIALRKRKQASDRGRQKSRIFDNARMLPPTTSYSEDVGYRRLMASPISFATSAVDSSWRWHPFYSTGYIVPQCHNPGDYCLPWGGGPLPGFPATTGTFCPPPPPPHPPTDILHVGPETTAPAPHIFTDHKDEGRGAIKRSSTSPQRSPNAESVDMTH